MVMKVKSLKKIDINIDGILKLNNSYEKKKEKIKLKPVNLGTVCMLGTVGSFVAMGLIGSDSLIGLELSCFGGYAVGCCLPYLVKKIRLLDLDYQIYSNNKIIDDLEKEKVKIKQR